MCIITLCKGDPFSRMNRIQSKDHIIGTYEINKISLSCFYDKIYIPDNRCD